MSFRFHVLAVPHTITSKDYLACAFTQKVLKFCTMMHNRKHIIYHYGHELSQVECTEHISIINSEILETAYGNYNYHKEFFKYENKEAIKIFNDNAIKEIETRKQKGDFILCFWDQKEVANAHKDLIIVRPGIGNHNSNIWAPYNIFESHSVMNNTYGSNQFKNPSWYDCVIPNYFDLGDFQYKDQKENYLLFIGRLIANKGLSLAVDVAIRTNNTLIVVGQGDYYSIMGKNHVKPDNVILFGYANETQRKILLASAKALILPTYYSEPFGGVVIEAGLSGTPVITTDWGAFAEIVLHGITGYRCRTIEQFCWAIKNINNIKPIDCRNWCENNFSLERVAKMYEEFFNSLYNVQLGKGFYHENLNRKELDWLNKKYPQIQGDIQEEKYPPTEQKKKRRHRKKIV